MLCALLAFSLCVVGFFWMGCCCGCGWSLVLSPSQTPAGLGLTETDFTAGDDPPDWYISPDSRLTNDSGSGSIWKTSPPPGPSWNASGMFMQATLWQHEGSEQGVFIGNGRAFWIDWDAQAFFQGPCGPDGQLTGDPVAIAGTPASGETLELAIQGGGPSNPGLYTILYLVNGALLIGSEETLVPLAGLDPTVPVIGGVWDNGGGQFTALSLGCGIPTMCGCALPQQLCARMINEEGNLGCSDVTFTLSYVPSSQIPSWVGTPASFPQGGWVGTFPGYTGLNVWPSMGIFLAPNCLLYLESPPCPLLFTGPPVGGGCSDTWCAQALKGCACAFSVQRLGGRSGVNIDAFTILISDPQANLCEALPGYLVLGNQGGGAATLCEALLTPLTVTLNGGCACFSGATIEVPLVSVSDDSAIWSTTVTLCGVEVFVSVGVGGGGVGSSGPIASLTVLNPGGGFSSQSQGFGWTGTSFFPPSSPGFWELNPIVLGGEGITCPPLTGTPPVGVWGTLFITPPV